MATVRPEDFEPPGPGLWILNVHFPRPVSRIHAELTAPAVGLGVRASQERYGVPARGGGAYVLRFQYQGPRTLVPLPRGAEAEARAAFARALASSDELSRRAAAAEHAFATKCWRAEVEQWDTQEKPEAVSRTLDLAAADLGALSLPELTGHVSACLGHLGDGANRHHRFNMTWMVPVGDLLAQVGEWTSLDAAHLLALMEGASPVSSGRSSELHALVDAIRADPAAEALLDSRRDPADIVASLRRRPDPVGAAARLFFDLHGHASAGGFDAVDPYALERPEALLEGIRAVLAPGAASDAADRVREATEAVRAAVPPGHRKDFDTLLAEARAVYRIKDERGLYNDMPAKGLVRRALLEAGRRMREAGRIEHAEHLLEAGPVELQEILGGRGGPPGDELRDRYDYRIANSDADPPLTLGAPDEVPVPIEWLPAGLQRVQRAIDAAQRDLVRAEGFVASDSPASGGIILHGMPTSRGRYTGTARVVRSPLDFERLQQGDVLVTAGTTPAISAWLPLLGAIVTDHGGALSHAAIVARERGLPAVVGTRTATSTIADGATVRVDGDAGTVEQVGAP